MGNEMSSGGNPNSGKRQTKNKLYPGQDIVEHVHNEAATEIRRRGPHPC